MSVDRIKELLALMDEHDLVELELEEDAFKVRLKKPGAQVTTIPAAMPSMPALPPAAQAASTSAETPDPSDEGLMPINSPIVGTFYRSPAPDADPFVSEGAAVTAETVVCIVEAMKIMNEVKAETKGTIEKVLIENGEPVEYGQAMFLVRP
jgi:acetyl-CoA carboxylase biotin carboxyl carrier protein